MKTPLPLQVIVTRPRAQAAAWIELLGAAGIGAAALPLIEIGPAPDAAAVAAAWTDLAHLRLAVFVSPNAVETFFAQAPAGARWPAELTAGSPGPGTTAALRRAGVAATRIVAPPDADGWFDSEALWLRLAGDDWRGARVLIVRGSGGREWLAMRLREAGAEVEPVAAYTQAVPRLDDAERLALDAALAAPEAHLWLFSSSLAIDHLGALVEGAHPDREAAWAVARALATHPRIAERAQRLGFGEVRTVAPLPDAVIGCIQSFRW